MCTERKIRNASVGRLLDQDQQLKRFHVVRNDVNSIGKDPRRQELEEGLFQYQEEGTEVDERTAELYSKQGNADIDETTQCKNCKENNPKYKSFCTCGVILQELSAEKTKQLKETTAHVMIRFSGFRWQIRTRGMTRHFSQQGKEPRREVSFPKRTEHTRSLCRLVES